MKFETWHSVSRQSSPLQFVSKSDSHLGVFLKQQPAKTRNLCQLQAYNMQNWPAPLRRGVLGQKWPTQI
jgi:hypothetical protein